MSTLNVPMLAAQCKVLSLWNASTGKNDPPPAGWDQPTFDDSTWSVPATPTAESAAGYSQAGFPTFGTDGSSQDFGRTPLFGAEPVWPSATPADPHESVLIRWTFDVPSTLPAHLQLVSWMASFEIVQITANGAAYASNTLGDADIANGLAVGPNVIAVWVNPVGNAVWSSTAWYTLDLRFTSLETFVWGTINCPLTTALPESLSNPALVWTGGNSYPVGIPTPAQIPLWGVSQVCGVRTASNQGVSMFLTEDGIVYMGGQDARLQARDPVSLETGAAVGIIPGVPPAVRIGLGQYNAWALDTDGNLWTWGTGSGGENLATGADLTTSDFSATYTPFISLANVSSFAPTYSGAVALTADGGVHLNGVGSYPNQPPLGQDWGGFAGWSPVLQWRALPFLNDVLVSDIASGDLLRYFLMADGTVRASQYASQTPNPAVFGDDGYPHHTLGGSINDLVIDVGPFQPLQGIVQVTDNGDTATDPGALTFYLDQTGALHAFGEVLNFGIFGSGATSDDLNSYDTDPNSGYTGVVAVLSPVPVLAIAGNKSTGLDWFAFIGQDGLLYTFGGAGVTDYKGVVLTTTSRTNTFNYIAGDGTQDAVNPPASRNGLTNVIACQVFDGLVFAMTDIGTYIPTGTGGGTVVTTATQRARAYIIG